MQGLDMRDRVGVPDEPDAASAWLSMAEAASQFLTPASQVEFASFLLTRAIESEMLEDEDAESMLALLHATEVLAGAGW